MLVFAIVLLIFNITSFATNGYSLIVDLISMFVIGWYFIDFIRAKVNHKKWLNFRRIPKQMLVLEIAKIISLIVLVSVTYFYDDAITDDKMFKEQLSSEYMLSDTMTEFIKTNSILIPAPFKITIVTLDKVSKSITSYQAGQSTADDIVGIVNWAEGKLLFVKNRMNVMEIFLVVYCVLRALISVFKRTIFRKTYYKF